MSKTKQISGFTLIELMVTVAIIAILAAIAYPSYTEYVIRAKRSDAKAALLAAQLAEEKYRANHITYGSLGEIGISTESPDGHYDLSMSGGYDAVNYAIIATPRQSDNTCGIFVIDQDGPNYNYGGGYADATCWGK